MHFAAPSISVSTVRTHCNFLKAGTLFLHRLCFHILYHGKIEMSIPEKEIFYVFLEIKRFLFRNFFLPLCAKRERKITYDPALSSSILLSYFSTMLLILLIKSISYQAKGTHFPSFTISTSRSISGSLFLSKENTPVAPLKFFTCASASLNFFRSVVLPDFSTASCMM